MTNPVFQAKILDGRGAVAAADYADRPVVRGLGDCQRDILGALIERRVLEDSHGSVPDDGLGVSDLVFEFLRRYRTYVNRQKARIDVTYGRAIRRARLQH